MCQNAFPFHKHLAILIRDATILQYIAIFIATIQYNTNDKDIDIIAYCNILQHLLPSKSVVSTDYYT